MLLNNPGPRATENVCGNIKHGPLRFLLMTLLDVETQVYFSNPIIP